ncbi:unnamed protein product [Schistocephalus solidus]|uniref:mRNA-decapping enzyme-like protein n=1 Tax=Schistocephalus solidus TaxID=70667 RepID=A0A183SIF3_SCHSO|nr:unnamed protein product [Schistocephalus solidus]
MDFGDEIDLSVLQKHDKTCVKILDKSPSVHLYSFNSEKTAWDKTDIGGVCFVCKHSTIPGHSFIILNRKNSKVNVSEPISWDFQLQIRKPYMMYKTVRGGIFSVWFFAPEDCTRIGNLLNRLRLQNPGPEPPPFPPLRSSSVSQDPTKPIQSSPTVDTVIESVSDSFSKLVSMIRQEKEVDTVPAFLSSQKSKQTSAKECHEEESPPADSSIIDMLSTAAANFKVINELL